MGDLTRNFSRWEFQCRCGCGTCEIEPRLVETLQSLRDLADVPCTVSSGWRCSLHPETKRNPNSQHARGLAADVRLGGLSVHDMYHLALQVPGFFAGGIGVYDDGFVHVDVGPGPRRWGRINGVYIGIREALAAIKRRSET